MISYNKRKNLLELRKYKYSLQDVAEPNLYRDNFTYDEIPKCTFNYRLVPMNMPDEIWITDTTFRDGQQARTPYTVQQIATLYEMLHRLGGPNGKIRQCEFFVYSENDRRAIEACREMGFAFPEITGWITEDFKLVKNMGLKECGILTSCSDYHIFNKLHKTRKEAMEGYLHIVESALDMGIVPRCHFEDSTRADLYGFVIPFATELQSELLEWHGHNDFYKAVVNATTSWLYGASAVNTSLLGIGERTGNTPLEAMVMEYAQMRGTLDGMDPTVITEIAEYFEKELDYRIPDRILNRPLSVEINKNSGLAGIAYWLNQYLKRTGDDMLSKNSPEAALLKDWVDQQYDNGRVTFISKEEMEDAVKRLTPHLLENA